MPEVNELHRRLDELETELNAVLQEKADLQRRLRHRRIVLRSITLFAALAFVGCCALAAAAAGPGKTVAAPFEVLDRFDKPIFAVKSDPRGFVLYKLGGAPALGGSVLDKSAFFKVAPDNQSANAVLGLTNGTPGMNFRGAGEKELIRFTTLGGTGRMVVMDQSAKNDIIQFLTGPGGEGAMELNSASGQLAVIASPSPGGFGRVEALPLGNPIGSFIVGRPKQ